MLSLAGLLCAPAFANCEAPSTPAGPPDGSMASRDEMLAGIKSVKAYDAAVQAYLDCIAKSGGHALEGDRAVQSLRAFADKFNKEFRAFKAKNGA